MGDGILPNVMTIKRTAGYELRFLPVVGFHICPVTSRLGNRDQDLPIIKGLPDSNVTAQVNVIKIWLVIKKRNWKFLKGLITKIDVKALNVVVKLLRLCKLDKTRFPIYRTKHKGMPGCLLL